MLCLAMTPSTSSDGSGVMRMLATETMMTIASPTLASRTMPQPSNTTRDRCQPTVAPTNALSNRQAPCETGRMKVVAVIPARLASTRLPRKMLREIAGVPLLAWVYQGVRRCSALDQVVVATDSDEIMRFCEQQGFVARMTSAAHRSGTERVHEISTAIPADVYLNVQGDELLTRPEHIESMIAVMQGAEVEVGTLKTPAV